MNDVNILQELNTALQTMQQMHDKEGASDRLRLIMEMTEKITGEIIRVSKILSGSEASK